MINVSDMLLSVFIFGSVMGYYGDLGEVVVIEEELSYNEFIYKFCVRWEEIVCWV